MMSLEGHMTIGYKIGVAREYSSVHGEPSWWADVNVVIPQVGNSAHCNRNRFGEGGIVTFSSLLILFSTASIVDSIAQVQNPVAKININRVKESY